MSRIGASRRPGRQWLRSGLPLAALAGLAGASLPAQGAPELARERAAFADWLASSPLSPYAALALQPVGAGITTGPDSADLPLEGVPAGTIREERGAVILTLGGERRPLPRQRPVLVGGRFRLIAAGPPGRTVVAAYGTVRRAVPPSFYPRNPALDLIVTLDPPGRRGPFPILGPDGIETEAVEVGFTRVTIGGVVTRLRVYRMAGEVSEAGELEIFFRDSTSGRESYPAGRFVALLPVGPGRYRLDFNRARNPFCAYNSVYPCPAPWPGNTIPAPLRAGERYGAAGKGP